MAKSRSFVAAVDDPYGNGQPLYTSDGKMIITPLEPAGVWVPPSEPAPAAPPEELVVLFLRVLGGIKEGVDRIAAGMAPVEPPAAPAEPPVQPPVQSTKRLHRRLRWIQHVQSLPLAEVAPPLRKVVQPEAQAPGENAGVFVHDNSLSYSENFNRYLALLPEVERQRLPREKQRGRQTSGPNLVAGYRGKYPGSESLFLRIVYRVRRKS